MSDLTMADLADGTRVHHAGWCQNGTIRTRDYGVVVEWDRPLGDSEIGADVSLNELTTIGDPK
jgi:hypothetical protein